MEDPSYNIAGCVLRYSDYKSAAAHWNKAYESVVQTSEFELLCHNVARELASSFEGKSYGKLLNILSASNFDFENDLRPVVDSLQAEKAASEEQRHKQKEEKERFRREADRLEAEKFREEQRLKEEKEPESWRKNVS
ncbi:MAG: hypothetical protein ACQKBV_04180 [Puniceicoccales bacterium]